MMSVWYFFLYAHLSMQMVGPFKSVDACSRTHDATTRAYQADNPSIDNGIVTSACWEVKQVSDEPTTKEKR